MIKGASKEERVNKWYEHFSNLLGEKIEPIANETFQVAPIFKDLYIDDGDFNFRPAKSLLKDGKHPGLDNIPLEVLKKCDLDDIILNFKMGEVDIHGPTTKEERAQYDAMIERRDEAQECVSDMKSQYEAETDERMKEIW